MCFSPEGDLIGVSSSRPLAWTPACTCAPGPNMAHRAVPDPPRAASSRRDLRVVAAQGTCPTARRRAMWIYLLFAFVVCRRWCRPWSFSSYRGSEERSSRHFSSWDRGLGACSSRRCARASLGEARFVSRGVHDRSPTRRHHHRLYIAATCGSMLASGMRNVCVCVVNLVAVIVSRDSARMASPHCGALRGARERRHRAAPASRQATTRTGLAHSRDRAT